LCASIIFPKQADLFEPKPSKKNEMWSKNDIKPYYLHYKKKYIKQYGKLTHYHNRCILTAVKRHIPKYFCRVCNEYSDYRIYKYDYMYIDCKTCVNKRTNKWIKKKIQTDDVYRFITTARMLISQSLRNSGYKKGSKSEQILGCEWDFFKDYIERRFQSGMSWDNYGEWHIDHKIPLSFAKNEEDIVKLCHYINLQPLWAEDNLKKSNKIIN
jgi:hypothetical protein